MCAFAFKTRAWVASTVTAAVAAGARSHYQPCSPPRATTCRVGCATAPAPAPRPAGEGGAGGRTTLGTALQPLEAGAGSAGSQRTGNRDAAPQLPLLRRGRSAGQLVPKQPRFAWVWGVGLRMGQVARSEASLACSTRTTAAVPGASAVEDRTVRSMGAKGDLWSHASPQRSSPSAARSSKHTRHATRAHGRRLPHPNPNSSWKPGVHTAGRRGSAPALRLATWWYSRSRASPWCRCHSSSSSGCAASKPEPRGGGGSACGRGGGARGVAARSACRRGAAAHRMALPPL